MTILLSLLGVAFAAFCVWLGVRIVNRRERWAKCAAIGLAVALLYPLSFGPACWWFAKPTGSSVRGGQVVIQRAPSIYMPIGRIARVVPRPFFTTLNWYATLGAGNDAIMCGYDVENRQSGSVFLAEFSQ